MNVKGKNIKNKTLVIVLIAVLIIIMGTGIINVSIARADERQRIEIIRNLISEGSYDEAVAKIDEFTDKYAPKVDKKVFDYRGILTSYNYINSCNYDIEVKKDIDKLKEDYSEILKEEIFVKLNEEISKKEKEIDDFLKREEEIKSLKEDILKSLENDIEKVQQLIDDFKKLYPEEDISEIENKLKEKLTEIQKEEDEKKEEDKSGESINQEESSGMNASEADSRLGIANTAAAQNSNQIITVVSSGGSYGELVMWEKDSSGNWIEVDRTPARLGQNGMKYSGDVYEMDKCTPTGIYTLTEAFGINGDPGSGIPYRELDGTEYWVDDIDSSYYNTMQFGEPNGRWSSAEKLIDFTGYYNYSIVIDYNRWPVVPGKSSAIFLHCDMGIYTYGCVAIPQNNLVNILTRLNTANNPVIILDFSYDAIYNNY